MRLGPLGFHGMVGVRRPRPEHAPLSRLASASRASRWLGLGLGLGFGFGLGLGLGPGLGLGLGLRLGLGLPAAARR